MLLHVHGSSLSIPFRPDVTGGLATVRDPAQIVSQQIYALVMTRQGERVMLPDFGLPDYIFAVKGAAFVKTLGYFLKQQIRKYIPGVGSVEVIEQMTGDEHAASVRVEWTLLGSNVPHNLVFPTRQLQEL